MPDATRADHCDALRAPAGARLVWAYRLRVQRYRRGSAAGTSTRALLWEEVAATPAGRRYPRASSAAVSPSDSLRSRAWSNIRRVGIAVCILCPQAVRIWIFRSVCTFCTAVAPASRPAWQDSTYPRTRHTPGSPEQASSRANACRAANRRSGIHADRLLSPHADMGGHSERHPCAPRSTRSGSQSRRRPSICVPGWDDEAY